jgi:hypothetical protein
MSSIGWKKGQDSPLFYGTFSQYFRNNIGCISRLQFKSNFEDFNIIKKGFNFTKNHKVF